MADNANLPPERVPVPYAEASALQGDFVERRACGQLGDLLWLLEHPSTVTLGSRGDDQHLVFARAKYAERGIELHRSDRGGDVTGHEPGQLVGYPIVLLGPEERDLHLHMRRVEEAVIGTLASFGVTGERIAGRTGVWLGCPERKIAALGVRAKRWVTSHGFALNVTNELAVFGTIVPCGISDTGVTSLACELAGATPSWGDLCGVLHETFESTFARPLRLVLGADARSV